MRRVCKLAARTLKMAGALVRPGISTAEINEKVHEFTLENGAIPAPLNYGADPSRNIPPFPKSVCTSVNEVICHGIPSRDVVIKNGDIIKAFDALESNKNNSSWNEVYEACKSLKDFPHTALIEAVKDSEKMKVLNELILVATELQRTIQDMQQKDSETV